MPMEDTLGKVGEGLLVFSMCGDAFWGYRTVGGQFKLLSERSVL